MEPEAPQPEALGRLFGQLADIPCGRWRTATSKGPDARIEMLPSDPVCAKRSWDVVSNSKFISRATTLVTCNY